MTGEDIERRLRDDLELARTNERRARDRTREAERLLARFLREKDE